MKLNFKDFINHLSNTFQDEIKVKQTWGSDELILKFVSVMNAVLIEKTDNVKVNTDGVNTDGVSGGYNDTQNYGNQGYTNTSNASRGGQAEISPAQRWTISKIETELAPIGIVFKGASKWDASKFIGDYKGKTCSEVDPNYSKPKRERQEPERYEIDSDDDIPF